MSNNSEHFNQGVYDGVYALDESSKSNAYMDGYELGRAERKGNLNLNDQLRVTTIINAEQDRRQGIVKPQVTTWHIVYANDDRTHVGSADIEAPTLKEAIVKWLNRIESRGSEDHAD